MLVKNFITIMFCYQWWWNKVSYIYYHYNRFTALCPELLGWAGTRRNIHSLTYPDHQPTFINFFHILRSIASSLFKFRAWQSFAQLLSMSSFVYLFAFSPPLHTPYVSLTNQCLLFATHANTIATCFAVVPRLHNLFLVSLSSLLVTLSCTLT